MKKTVLLFLLITSFHFLSAQNDTDTTLRIIGVPNDTTIQCQFLRVPAWPIASDVSGNGLPIYLEHIRTPGRCETSFIDMYIWSVTRAGYTVKDTQTITVIDTTAPVFGYIAPDTTVSCSALQAWLWQSVNDIQKDVRDNCFVGFFPMTESYKTLDSSCAGNYTFLRTLTARDPCGNTSTTTQRVKVVDAIAPVLSTAPVNISVSCDAVPPAAVLIATDNCNPTPVIEFNETRTNGSSPCIYVLTRTWRATDGCNTSATQTQTITVTDNKAPVLSALPADVTVSCDAVPAAAIITATDNCSPAPVVTYTETKTTTGCAGNYILKRTWIATDACNNVTSHTQTITVRDTKAPVITCTPSVTHCQNTNANHQYAIPVATATDNCAANLVYNYIITGATQRSGSGNNASGTFNWGTSLIEWTVTDECGNTARCSTSVLINSESIALVPDVKASKGTVANTIYVGYTPASLLTYSVDNLPGYKYTWSVSGNLKIVGSATGNTVKVTYLQLSDTDGTLTLLVTNTGGCTQTITKDINVADVRGGNKKDKVVICHNGKSNTVDEHAVPAHLGHGYYLGACGSTPVIDVTAPAIKAYPNPSAGEFNVQLLNYKSSHVTISIINERGDVIAVKSITLNGKGSTIHFNLTGCPKGLYFIKAESLEGVQTAKIVIQ